MPSTQIPISIASINKQDYDYKNIVQKLLNADKNLRSNMGLNVHFLKCQQFFPQKSDYYGEDQGNASFHQDIKRWKADNQGRCGANIRDDI